MILGKYICKQKGHKSPVTLRIWIMDRPRYYTGCPRCKKEMHIQ